jgi:beta-lactamase regulating signal transducer with metallopeptidase domain
MVSESGMLGAILTSNVQIQVAIRVAIASAELAVLSLVVACVARVFRPRTPRFIAWLWGLVLLKSLATLMIGSPLFPARIEIYPPSPLPETTLERDRGWFKNIDASLVDESQQRWTVSFGAPAVEVPFRNFSVELTPKYGTYLKAIGILWVVGILLGALRWIMAGYVLRCIIARGAQPGPRLLEIYEAEVASRGLSKAPRLCLSSEVESPVLFGAFQPTILLPVWLADDNRGMLRHVFAHELMHYTNRDALFLAIGQVGLLLFFFHPLAYRAFRQWLFNAELACDRALVRSAAEARNYARELLDILDRMQRRRGALSGLYATRFQLASRMNALLLDPLSVATRLSFLQRLVIILLGLAAISMGFRVDIKSLDQSAYDTVFIGSTELRQDAPFMEPGSKRLP